MTSQPKGPKRARPSFQNLGRAIRFLGHYRNIALAAYGALLLSTSAQLLVPQLVQNILDAVTRGMIAQQLSQAPAEMQANMLAKPVGGGP